MSERSFCVVTFGRIVAGFKRGDVVENLDRLCKLPPQRVDKVFSGARFVFKSGLDREGAERYLTALTRAGIVCSVERELFAPPNGLPIQITCPMCGTVQNASRSCIQCEVLLAKPRQQAAIDAAERPLADTLIEDCESVQKRTSPLTKVLLVLLIVGVIGTGAVVIGKVAWTSAGKIYQQVKRQVESQQAEVSEIPPPPAVPPLQTLKPHLSGAELQALYTLFETRQFALLNQKLTSIQLQFENDPTFECKIDEAFDLFSEPYLPHRPLYDEWVAQFPDHFAPYLARGIFLDGLGWERRGNKYARETSDDQFSGMADAFDLALADFSSALQINPRLHPAYITMVSLYKAQGLERELEATIVQGLELFPTSYQLYKKILDAKLPRWGGSYGEMNLYAQQANLQVALNLEMPFLYGKPYLDQAWYAKRDKKYQEAIDLYTQALAYGEYEWLFELRGLAYEKIGDPDRALLDYARATELNPGYDAPYRHSATLYFRRSEYGKALAMMQTAQNNQLQQNKDILAWYNWTIRSLLRANSPEAESYRVQANQYQPVRQAKSHPTNKPLQPLKIQLRFKAPEGSQPYGLAWFAGSLYMSSYKTAAGVYQLDPEDGRVVNRGAPDIAYKEQFGGLAADKEQLYHVQGQFSNDCNPLDPATLEPKDKFFLYSSQFHLGDLALHNNHLYAIGYHRSDDVNDYRLLKFSLDGKLRRSIAITVIPNRSASPGLASDGRWLYTSMGDALYKLDPETGDVVEGFAVPDAFYGIAYDGEQLWGAGWDGNVYSFVVK